MQKSRRIICFFIGMAILAAGTVMTVAHLRNSGDTNGRKISDFYNVMMQDGADPWMVRHTDGYYYYTQTTGGNVKLWRSKTLTGIGAGESKTVWTPPAGTMYSSNIWAPELHYLDGKWYIYFAADDGSNENHRMYVLENPSSNPLAGEWTFKGKISDPSDSWAIDGTVLTVGSDRYFVWSGWDGTINDKQNLYIAKMGNPWTISSGRTLISTPRYDWETNTSPEVNEGPELIIRNQTINLVYSASGSWTDDYCLALITAPVSADLLDAASWSKRSEPLFTSNGGIYGPGHHSMTQSPDGREDWMVYHTARWKGAGWTRNVRAQKFTWNPDDTPNLGTPAPPDSSIPLPSGEPKRTRYEAEEAKLSAGAVAEQEETASGGAKVIFEGGQGSLEWAVHAPQDGEYILSFRVCNGTSSLAPAALSLTVNGKQENDIFVNFSGRNHWGAYAVTVHLNKGNNVISAAPFSNDAELDFLDVSSQ